MQKKEKENLLSVVFFSQYLKSGYLLLHKKMRVSGKEHVPEDHRYFRSSYVAYRNYLERGQKLAIVPLGNCFGWVKFVLGKSWRVAKFDRVDEEPSVAAIRKTGLRHGLLIWIPWKRKPSFEELKS
jgi:hypothetical protein